MEIFEGEVAAMRENRRLALTNAKLKWEQINKLWEFEGSALRFNNKLSELATHKIKYEKLGDEYNRERLNLNNKVEELQLERFLSNYFIKNHQIPKIGDNRKLTLSSFGIDTAADILKLNKVKIPGFGSFLEGQLFVWRDNLAKRFKFNPSKGLDPEDLNKLNRKFELIKIQLEANLKSGPEILLAIKNQIIQKRVIIKQQMTEIGQSLRQAQIDVDVL